MKYSNLTKEQIDIVYRLAKDRRRGLRPFFRHPRDMIALRELVEGGPWADSRKGGKQEETKYAFAAE